MWPIILIAAGFGLYWALKEQGTGPIPQAPTSPPIIPTTPAVPTAPVTPAPPPTDLALLQARNDFLGLLRSDLASGGDPLGAGVTDTSLADTYANVYVSGSDAQVKTMIIDARRRNYNKVADYLLSRLPPATGERKK